MWGASITNLVHIEIAGEPGLADTAFDDLDKLHPDLRRELLQLLYVRLSETSSDMGDSGTFPGGMWRRATRRTHIPTSETELGADYFVFVYRPLTRQEEGNRGPGYMVLRVMGNDEFVSLYRTSVM